MTATVSLASKPKVDVFLAKGKAEKAKGEGGQGVDGFEIALTGSQALPLHGAGTNIDYASA